jgi:hypothetical protein
MNKRLSTKYVAIPLTLTFLLAGSPGFSQINGVTDTSKEGSLLVWPFIQTTGGSETYITVANSSKNAVSLKCYWEIKDVRSDPRSECLLYEFVMPLGGFAPITFRASDGSGLDNRVVAGGMGSAEEAALRCWAVDPTGSRQISWNHLSGAAVIVNKDNTAPGVTGQPTASWGYNAWRFAANVIDSSGNFADGFWVGEVAGVGGVLVNKLSLKAGPTTVVTPANCPGPDYSASGCSLPNAVYDACPKYLTFDFLADTSGAGQTDGFAMNSVALATCKADLTDYSLNLRTKLVYTIWNEKNLQIRGPSRCVNADSRSDLGSLSIPRNQYFFRYRYLKTPTGRFRVDSLGSSACGTDAVATPLLGVIWSKLANGTGLVGSTGSASGKETSDYGYILWLPSGNYYQ